MKFFSNILILQKVILIVSFLPVLFSMGQASLPQYGSESKCNNIEYVWKCCFDDDKFSSLPFVDDDDPTKDIQFNSYLFTLVHEDISSNSVKSIKMSHYKLSLFFSSDSSPPSC